MHKQNELGESDLVQAGEEWKWGRSKSAKGNMSGLNVVNRKKHPTQEGKKTVF